MSSNTVAVSTPFPAVLFILKKYTPPDCIMLNSPSLTTDSLVSVDASYSYGLVGAEAPPEPPSAFALGQ